MHQDLDSIEELNYISTVEEDVKIDAYIAQLREWGYGSIKEVNDLHQLFWEMSHRGLVMDKLFRVAVVECIDEEPLYTKFLGMARHYNGWKQRVLNEDAAERKKTAQELEALKKSNADLLERLHQAKVERSDLKQELEQFKLLAKPKSEGAQMNELRHELRKEYTTKLDEARRKHKPAKLLRIKLLKELSDPTSRLFNAYDLTQAEDATEYVEWWRIAERKINVALLRNITARYEGHNIDTFLAKAETHNAEWSAKHQGEEDEESL